MEIPSEKMLYALANHMICRRAVIMYSLLSGYSLFSNIQLGQRCMNIKITYKDAETITDTLEKVTGIAISPKELMINEDEQVNKLLDQYQQLKTTLNTFEGTMRSAVDAYYHYLFYCKKVDSLQIQSALLALTAFLNYINGSIDKKKFKNSIVAFDLRQGKLIPIDSKHIRRLLIDLEQDFHQITLKCENRRRLKAGEKPYATFDINMTL